MENTDPKKSRLEEDLELETAAEGAEQATWDDEADDEDASEDEEEEG